MSSHLNKHDLICRIYCGLLLVIWLAAPYFILQRVEIFPTIWIPQLAIDKAIPVNFHAIWVYNSFYLLLALAGLLLEKKWFIRYIYTIGWVTLVSHMVFLFMPSGVSRAEIDFDSAPLFYQRLANMDLPRNALPSLHASLTIVAAIAVQCSTIKRGVLLKSLIWLWTLAIFWSTIALRQHVVLDLIAGAILAFICWKIIDKSSELKHHLS